jgi:ribosomal protein S6E (S10)
VIGASLHFGEQPHQKKLDAHEDQQGGQDEKGIAIHFNVVGRQELLIDDNGAAEKGGEKADDAHAAEDVEGFGAEIAEEFDGDQVEQDLEGPADAVF